MKKEIELTSLEQKVLVEIIRPSITDEYPSHLGSHATIAQDLDFVMLLRNVKEFYNNNFKESGMFAAPDWEMPKIFKFIAEEYPSFEEDLKNYVKELLEKKRIETSKEETELCKKFCSVDMQESRQELLAELEKDFTKECQKSGNGMVTRIGFLELLAKYKK